MNGIYPKNMDRYQDAPNILTTPLIPIWMESTRRELKGTKMLSKYSQLYSYLYEWNSSEEYKKVPRCSQHIYNSTHTYMNGIFPKNMKRYQNALKTVTTLLIIVWMDSSEDYEKVPRGSHYIYNSDHTFMNKIWPRNMKRYQNALKIVTTLLIATWMKFTRRI